MTYLIRSSIAAVLFTVSRWLDRAGMSITVWFCDDCDEQRPDAIYRDSASIRCDACQERWERS
jgi:hypothetical protein